MCRTKVRREKQLKPNRTSFLFPGELRFFYAFRHLRPPSESWQALVWFGAKEDPGSDGTRRLRQVPAVGPLHRPLAGELAELRGSFPFCTPYTLQTFPFHQDRLCNWRPSPITTTEIENQSLEHVSLWIAVGCQEYEAGIIVMASRGLIWQSWIWNGQSWHRI